MGVGSMSEWHPDIPEEYRNAIVTGDARLLAERIPDASVDLIFTDPVYDRIEDYEWLARTAARVLKPSGAVLVWSNGKWHHDNARWLEDAGLDYRYDFASIMLGGPMPMCGRVIAKTHRLIWLDVSRASKMVSYLVDGHQSVFQASSHHKWGKTERFTEQAISAFTAPQATVYDPFTGGGTVPAVCKMLGRNYIASEIDPDTAERARQRVLMTQPPLFVQSEEQSELWAG